MERENLKSRLGFILLSAGCAIGIGNVWRFPYIVGNYGGGIFVLFYLFFLALIGIPVLTIEFSIGRASQKSTAKAYQELEPRGTKWHLHVVVLGFGVCSLGLQKGVEKITKVMMTALLGLIIILAIHAVRLDGGIDGVKFYLLPNFEKIQEVGFFKLITTAMNQAFFTLSIGMGSMMIFGSYIDKSRTLLGESINIALLDTFVAIIAGLIIFPSCFAFNVEPDSGPSLIFITLPNVFTSMKGGRIWGSLFFLFMTFAAFSTVIALFENILTCCVEKFNITRKKAVLINIIIISVLSLPCGALTIILKRLIPVSVRKFQDGLNRIINTLCRLLCLFC